jgi:geranylgeranyl pyrophosphate synthase
MQRGRQPLDLARQRVVLTLQRGAARRRILDCRFELFALGDTPRGNGEASSSRSHHDPATHVKVIREVARAIGTDGMIGGQVVDIAFASRKAGPKTLEYIHAHKTGALIAASVRVGALLGRATLPVYRSLSRYGSRIGLVFQLVDDLLDSDGAVRIYGQGAVRRRAEQLTKQAIAALAPLGRKGEVLKELARFILARES